MLYAIEIELLVLGVLLAFSWGIVKLLNILMQRAERKARAELEAKRAARERATSDHPASDHPTS